MLTGRKLGQFRRRLSSWFREFQRDLPWRKTRDPYRIWISEIMLQQTRVAAVIPYYERFLERFPNLRALAEAPQDEVLRLWSGLGYYSRARNLQSAAQQIVEKHGGEFPRREEAVLSLPGIGSYTAAAILSIAFGLRKAVLDGNVARVLARLGAIRGDLRKQKRWRTLQTTAEKLLDPKSPGEWNQAMMELGATVCTPRAPQCLLCPVAKFCRARQLGNPESFPAKSNKKAAVEITLAAAILTDSGSRTLLLPPPQRGKKRPDVHDVATLVSGMWHFPTVAIRKNPTAELKAYLAELLQSKGDLPQLEPLAKVRHAVTYRNIEVLPFRLAVAKIPRIDGSKKIPLEDLSALPISNLTRKIALAAMQTPTPPTEKRASLFFRPSC
jgi:A/G-specific adenine glycosylase